MLRRIPILLGPKLGVWIGLALGICIPYFGIQRALGAPSWTPAATPIDDWVAFDPGWVFAYQSIALLVPIVPLLVVHREELIRYARGLALLCLPCFLIFWLFPVAGPVDHAAYGWLAGVDSPANSLPSLHAGLTVYSFCFAWSLLRHELNRRSRVLFLAGAGLWTSLILYATLATKQHWLLDLPPGVFLGWLANRLTWRLQPAAVPAEEASLAFSAAKQPYRGE
jgi:membrane-associated phospholipid phosphatase